MKHVSIEELEKAAQMAEEDDDIVIGKLNEAQKFILANDIKRGTELVSAGIIYDKYKTWKKTYHQSKIAFFMAFTKYFAKKKIGGGFYYYLDSTPFDMSTENYWKVRRQIREENARQKKRCQASKKNQEKSSKVSSTES